LPNKPWADELSDSLSPVLKSWIKSTLIPSSITRLVHNQGVRPDMKARSASAQVELPPMSPKHVAMAETLHTWLEHLRPDEVPLDQIHVLEQVNTRSGTLEQRLWTGNEHDVFIYAVHASRHILLINGAHEFVRTKRMDRRMELAWMLLGAYACINEVLQHVTNKHEMTFQRRLIQEVILA
jgi:hypothetical protein